MITEVEQTQSSRSGQAVLNLAIHQYLDSVDDSYIGSSDELIFGLLIPPLSYSFPPVQISAIWALQKLEAQCAAPALVERLLDCNTEVREAAAVALAHIVNGEGLVQISRRIESLLIQAAAKPESRADAIAAIVRNAPLFAAAWKCGSGTIFSPSTPSTLK